MRRGLKDISVSRSVRRARGWGIGVPGDPSQVIYVWFDALANYISALGFGAVDSPDYRRWWLESDERVHVVGKGILRFHAVYWPAFLASAGQPSPTRIQVHPYLTAGGQKLSKSGGNVVDPRQVAADYGTDAVRWWFARDVTAVADTDYTPERLIARANEDLANGLGNVTNRIVTLVHRLRGGLVADVGRRARCRGTRRRARRGCSSRRLRPARRGGRHRRRGDRAQPGPRGDEALAARRATAIPRPSTSSSPATSSAPATSPGRPDRSCPSSPPGSSPSWTRRPSCPDAGARLRAHRVTSGSLPGYGESFALTIRSGPCCEHLAEREATVHIPDGFIDGPTSAAGGAAAVGLVGVSLKMAAKELDDKQVPLAGLTAAFVFAVQMLNFPVAAGTSGHLLGGCLAAVLVGPWVATVCMTVVLGVQALVFADGGLSALGLNVILMGVVTCFVGYAAFGLGRRLLPATKAAVATSAGVAAWFSVIVSALVFTGFYALGGAGGASITTVGTAMVGVHALIGIGEGLITASTIAAVLATRPDLVYGARDLQPRLEVRVPAAVRVGGAR